MSEINITGIKNIYERNKDIVIASGMSKYLKNKFEFYGIKKPLRTEISIDILKISKTLTEDEIIALVWDLWNEDYRELQYLALDLLRMNFKKTKIDINFVEKLIVTKSWWDSVDALYHHTGLYFKNNYEDETLWNWVGSDNIWLNRSAILFQLKYKNETDLDVLKKVIISLKHKNEFFIQKAIGWSLREYAKTNANFVINLVEELELKGLAKREALKHLKDFFN